MQIFYPTKAIGQSPWCPFGAIHNLAADYGADPTGTNDSTAAVNSFNAAFSGQNACLYVPPGSYKFSDAGGAKIGKGLTGLVASGYGATLTAAPTGSISLGGQEGVLQNNTTNALFQTSAAGATSVTLVTAAQISRFTVSNWVMLSGGDLQGSSGYPPNPFLFEYAQIRSINSGTGVITFTAPLKYGYKSTWPSASSGSVTWSGGPATVYALPSGWNQDLTFMGFTFQCNTSGNASQQIYQACRNLKLIDCGSADNTNITPTQTLNWTCINGSFPNASFECDKLVTNMAWTGGSVKSWQFQSRSIDSVVGNNVTFTGTTGLLGTPKSINLTNCTVNGVHLGCSGYGNTDKGTFTNCSISAIIGTSVPTTNVKSSYTISGGTISFPLASGIPSWMVPGANIFFYSQYDNEDSLFQVVDVTSDGTNYNITTTMVGGWPNPPLDQFSHLNLRPHPCPNLTLVNCTGSRIATDLSQAPAQGQPFASYTSRTYTIADWGSGTPALQPDIETWGNITSITFNVTTSYTGAQSQCLLSGIDHFQNTPLLNPNGSTTNWGAIINMKVAGLRTVIPGSAPTGLQSGDSIATVASPSWLMQVISPFLQTDISGDATNTWPTVVITVVTNQGVTAP